MTDDRVTAVDRRKSDGASVVMHDPRVSSIQNWLFGVIGAGIIGGIIWVGTNISGLRETVVRLVTQNEFILGRLDDHEDRIKDVEKRP
jgi:hypothetical protein